MKPGTFLYSNNRFGKMLEQMTSGNKGTKRIVSVNICSVEGNSAGIFVSKRPPGIFVIKVK